MPIVTKTQKQRGGGSSRTEFAAVPSLSPPQNTSVPQTLLTRTKPFSSSLTPPPQLGALADLLQVPLRPKRAESVGCGTRSRWLGTTSWCPRSAQEKKGRHRQWGPQKLRRGQVFGAIRGLPPPFPTAVNHKCTIGSAEGKAK